MKNQFYKNSIVNILFGCVIISLGFATGAAQKKTLPIKPAANSSEIVSQTIDISAAAQKICKKVKTIDDRTGSDFDLMCGGANGYNFYFWLDSETKKPTAWGYIRNAKIPNFYPLMAIGGIYYEEEGEEADTPKKGATSEATEYYNSPDYKSKVGDKIEWFTRGGKTVAYAVHAFFFKDPDNTLKVFDSKKAAAEFVFVRGVGDYESLEHDLNVRKTSGNADERARTLVNQYFAKKK